MHVLKAAQIMETAYLAPHKLPQRAKALKESGVEAYFLPGRVVVVVGTNHWTDWLDNLDIRLRATRIASLLTRPGASGAVWHSGFLDHAEVLYQWAQPLRPRLLIGHSLGAAAVQIVGSSLRTPTIAFASPRTKLTRRRFSGEARVLNICRTDDTVVGVPPGFRRLGQTGWLKPPRRNLGGDHKMKFYIQLLKNPAVSARIPKQWP